MLRQWTTLIALSFLVAAGAGAQGLNTHASPNDWEEINFEFNSAVLSDGFPSLLRLADLLKENHGYHVKVEGNTDNLGSRQYNEKLGQQRADAVKAFLVHYGASAGQVDAVTRGMANPQVPGYKNTYSQTDVARWMNRRVMLTVTDQNGKTIGEGGMKQVIPQITQQPGEMSAKCCDDILKRLDKLDDIMKMLRDLADQNAGLRREIDNLKQQQAALENKVNGMPKPLTEGQTSAVVDKRLEANRDPRFSLMGLNVGADDVGHVTFTGSGRYFAPFREHFAIQAQGEYLYFHSQKEGQFDFGLVDRFTTRLQGGLFASFKHVNLAGYGSGGTLGQGAAMFDYLFSRGKVGIFGTKGFLDNPILDERQAVLSNGAVAPNLYIQRFLHITDQVGLSGTVALWGRNYAEGNLGYLRAYSTGDRAGGTIRFVFPIAARFALTAEGGVNETMMQARGSSGRAVFGFQWGNLQRPKEYLDSQNPVPMQVPRVRYEVVTRNIMKGSSPPVADAGPDQIGIPAGTVTLNGSNSYDPNGLPLTYVWRQETGQLIQIANQTSAISSFTAGIGESYTFRLTVTNSVGLSASARTHVTTRAAAAVQILFFNANPSTIQSGQASQLSYQILNATSATITGIGNVNPSNGNLPVSPTATTTYVLTAKNDTSQQSATATVTVMNPQVQILTCTATPMNIMQGESATLVWAPVNATSVSIAPGIGSVAMSGSTVVSPTSTTTYTITASGAAGTTAATCQVVVQVTPGTAPRIIRFTANPTTIVQGATSTLVWQVENATTVTITPTLNSVPLIGTGDVTPPQTTTYTLTATNNFGSVSATATVTVTPPPPPPTNPNVAITSFTANPPVSPAPGSPVVLTCIATNATSVVINGVGPVNANNQVTVNPQTTTTYMCTATGNGPPATATVTVPVKPLPPPPVVTPPTVVVTGINGLMCSATATVGSNGATYICETVVRQVSLDLSQSTSPAGNTPLTYLTTSNSRNTNAAVLNATSVQPTVQLGEQFGDYFFTVVVTDSKGNQGTATVDIRLVVTRVP